QALEPIAHPPLLLGAPAMKALVSQILGLGHLAASEKPLERCPVVFLCAARTFLAKTAPSGSAIKRLRSVGVIDDHDAPAVVTPDLIRSESDAFGRRKRAWRGSPGRCRGFFPRD